MGEVHGIVMPTGMHARRTNSSAGDQSNINGFTPPPAYAVDPRLMQNIDKTRRTLVRASMLAALGAGMPASATLLTTPQQTRGPFYPVELPLDSDNDLARVEGMDRLAQGSICDLQGRILDAAGEPIGDAFVEIWQCDVNGVYRHPGDRNLGDRDSGFQGYGSFRTGSNGRYRFRTIRPMPYGQRTPHIHFAVRTARQQELVTQLYVSGERRNERDFLYQRIPPDQRKLVTVPFVKRRTNEAELQAEFDIVLPSPS